MPSSLGPAEIIVILVVALIVLGPKRLPEAGRQVGKALSELRRWTQDVKSEVTSAFDAEQAAANRPPATTSSMPVAPAQPVVETQAEPAQPQALAQSTPAQVVAPQPAPEPKADEAERPESPPAL